MPRKKKELNETVKPFSEQKDFKDFKYEPKSLLAQAAYSDWYDSIYPSRDDSSNHGPSRDALRFNNLIGFRIPYQEYGRFTLMREPIRLCQVAWREVPVFYQTVETMTDLTSTPIKLAKGSDRGRKFFTSWFNTIHLNSFQTQFFRETYRSGNIFVYRFDGSIKSNKLNKFTFGADREKEAKAAKTIDIPVRYIILNPAFVCLFNGLELNNVPIYYWMVDTSTRDQLKRLKDSGTNINFSKETQEILNNNISETELNSDKLYPIFYRKQDYEPFALPMGYPVLDDINLKLEFKKCDQIVAKTVESIITLVTHGAVDKDGNVNVNPLVAQSLEKMFLTKQTGRTIVSTTDTKIEFQIPELKKVVGPEKYEKLDSDINDGLMNIFFGNQKFANIMVKLRVFVERLENVQDLFLNEFLIPEMKRVGKLAGYKPEEIPIPKFAPIQIDDTSNANRVIAQLLQLGVFTPKDGIEAMQSGLLPDYDDLLLNQKDYKANRDKGLFLPLIGGMDPTQQVPGQAGGRPIGAKAPKKSSKPGFKGGSSASELGYDVLKFRENTILASQVANTIQKKYKIKHGKIKLSPKDKENIQVIATHLSINEPPNKWEENIVAYLGALPEPNLENISHIEEIKESHEVDDLGAALLMWSERE